MGLIDFDLFAKPNDDFKQRTALGGIVSIVSMILCFLLLVACFINFRKVTWESEIMVDTKHKEQMILHFDITFPALPCMTIGLDVIDVAGEHQMNILKSVEKVRIGSNGIPLADQLLGENSINIDSFKETSFPENGCGSCYAGTELSPESPFGINCCNTCDEVIGAYKRLGIPLPPLTTFEQCLPSKSISKLLATRKGEGCRLHGYARVNRIPGNIHIAPGVSFQIESAHLHDLRPFDDYRFNLSHRIDKLYFDSVEGYSMDMGDTVSSDDEIKKNLISNPLEGTLKIASSYDMAFLYTAKVVSTEIKSLSGASITTHQYSATAHSTNKPPGGLPGVFFDIDISPLIILYSEQNAYSWLSFMAQLFAIIGGIYTIASLLDAFLYQAERRLAMKRQLGKTT
ncbi:ER-derived vesicles protein erv46 [Mitosporidium daphniae]